MLKPNQQIVAMQNRYGTEYIIQNKNRKNLQSIQLIVAKGKRRSNFDTALAEEYLLYVKHTIYSKKELEHRYIRIDVACKYLNTLSAMKSIKSRWIISNVLRLMYSFFYLMGYQLESLTYEQALALVDFFKNSSKYVTYDEVKVRDSNTIALYLAHIRSYVRWLGYGNNHPLLKSNLISYRDETGSVQSTVKNVITVRHYHEDTIRYYIKCEEYLKVREAKCITNQHDRLMVKCIVDLMFLHGLRLGEVLSLTLEDFYTESDGTTCISIRNRFTKDKYRMAKGCINVLNPSDYYSREYQENDIGYQIIYLQPEVVKNLMTYISETHEFLKPRTKADLLAFRRHKKTYKEKSVADTVAQYINSDLLRAEMKLSDVEQMSIDGKNHYLFLNTQFSPLTDSRWNQILKKVMIDENIGVDTGRKRFGLNHRFRHGFAMFLVNNMKMDEYRVMRLMRHHSFESIEPYMKMTAEDVRDMRSEYTQDTFDIIQSVVGKDWK